MNIFPNPLTSSIIIKINESGAILKIYSISEQLLNEEKLKKGENTVNTQELSKGIYLLEVISGGKSNHYKVIKE